MEIQLESTEPHTIRSYSDHSIQIDQTIFDQSCIISKQAIQTDWAIHHIDELNAEHLNVFIHYRPEIVLIGHAGPSRLLPQIASELSKHRIGLECMSIGAACRSFNVLLSEQRAVVLALIFAST